MKVFFGKFYARAESPEAAEPKKKHSEDEDNALCARKETEMSSKHTDTYVACPFRNVKALDVSSPFLTDASVFVDLQKEEQIPENDEKEEKDETKDEIKGDIENDKKQSICTKETCDTQTCTEAKYESRIGDVYSIEFPQHNVKDKISPTKLTAMINSSIKEAMETIVKQCRMNEEKNNIGKQKDENKNCRKMAPMRARRERQPHRIHELNNYLKISKSRLQRKCKGFRSRSKKLHDENFKNRRKKRCIYEQDRKEKSPTSANRAKADNRQMTGNVNIYICSEANENAQATMKQKKNDPSTESSSETTEQSKYSLSKLINPVRNKRKKSEEQDFPDSLSDKEESSDNSTSSPSKYTDSYSTTKLDSTSAIDISKPLRNDIYVKDSSSTLIDGKYKNENSVAIEKSKFVTHDKMMKPCSTIYTMKSLSNSESDRWTSISNISSRNTDFVPCNSWALGANLGDYTSESENGKMSKNHVGSFCKCRKRDRELAGTYHKWCNCGGKKYSKTIEGGNCMQPWSTCTRITEEDEENICDDTISLESGKSIKEKRATSFHKKTLVSKRPTKPVATSKHTTCRNESPKKVEEKTPENTEISKMERDKKIAETKTDKEEGKSQEISKQISAKEQTFTRGKLVKPEVILLKNILKQLKSSEATREDNVASTPAKTLDTKQSQNGDSENRAQVSAEILKKYNLHGQQRNQKQSIIEEKQVVPEEKKEEDKLEEKVVKKEKDTKFFQEWYSGGMLLLLKRLPKFLGKLVASDRKPEEPNEKDKITEAASADTRTDKDVETPRTRHDEDQFPEKSKIETRRISKKKDKPMSSKKHPNKLMRNRSNKPEPSTISSKNKERKSERSNIKKVSISPVEKIQNEKDDVPNVQSTKEVQSEDSRKVSESQETQEKNDARVSLKRLQFEEKSNIEEKIESVSQKAKTQDERPDLKMQPDADSVQKSIKVSQFGTESHKSNSETKHTNSTHTKNPNTSDYLPDEERTLDLPISECSNKPMNYPKGCLKKEKQRFRVDSQENDYSISQQNDRVCRKFISCNFCRGPKKECRCRSTVPCADYRESKNTCNCKSIYEAKNSPRCMKSMFCLYCDNPRDKCTCMGPARKCSCCELSVGLCMCKDQNTICDGRPVLTEPDKDRIIYVTAWKPREEVRRYFSRNFTDSTNECCCYEKLKSHKSNDLPYQNLSVFSDVMDELQHKISESTCCTRCQNIPCCCNMKIEMDEGKEERMMNYCISPKTRRRVLTVCTDKSENVLSNNCQCDCNCVSSEKKPRAKCYYCKSSPCTCITSRERNKSRSCRCTDSPCHAKEKESIQPGKTFGKPKNNNEKTICVR